MSSKTNEQLTLEIQQLKTQVQTLSATLYELKQDVNSRVRLSDLARSEERLNQIIKDNSELIVKLEQKLAKVSLPEDTRYYLSETEIADFRSNFNKLLAMLSSFEQLYKSLVAYSIQNANGTTVP